MKNEGVAKSNHFAPVICWWVEGIEYEEDTDTYQAIVVYHPYDDGDKDRHSEWRKKALSFTKEEVTGVIPEDVAQNAFHFINYLRVLDDCKYEHREKVDRLLYEAYSCERSSERKRKFSAATRQLEYDPRALWHIRHVARIEILEHILVRHGPKSWHSTKAFLAH